jgi:hypothetical protein
MSGSRASKDCISPPGITTWVDHRAAINIDFFVCVLDLWLMSSVEQIQSAIQQLPEAEYHELAGWWEAYEEQVWDEKLARDSKPDGRLDKFLREIDADIDSGHLTSFPK